MHPATSLVLFSTLSGMGLGLMTWLGLGLGPDGAEFGWLAAPVALALSGGGLSASTFHLRRPDRAWRAFSQWRSSWLSREAWTAVAALGVFGLYALIWLFGSIRIAPLGWLAAALSLATVFTTSMIYTQLKTVPRWRTPLTPAVFLAFALASGALALAALAAVFGGGRGPVLLSLALLVVAVGVKLAWTKRAEGATLASVGATVEAATGLGDIGRARLFEAPHTGSNYLMKEMVFEVGRRRARAIRRVAAALGAGLPALLLLLALATDASAALLIVAAVSALLGLFAERWLFFAEAQHAVAAYYGRR